MTTMRGTGWREREAAAKAKLALRDAGYNLALTEKEQARHALREAQAAEARAYMEEREWAFRETVAECPCCSGKGHVIVIEGAAWMEAVERYRRVGWKPDPATIGLMMQRAFDVDREGNRIGQTTPSPVAETVETKRSTRRHVPPPFLEDE